MTNVDLHTILGLGVIGNFAGHLKQAGEDKFFAPAAQEIPKGLFPFYVPHERGVLGTFPFSSERIATPATPSDVQPEPELGLLCDVTYEGKRIANIAPVAFAAHNDCSMRNHAPKISLKKNWGADSKGTSATFLPIDRFAKGGVLDRYRIACYLQRGGEFHLYGIDSPATSYTYFYKQLTDWLVERIAQQEDSGPLELLLPFFETAKRPRRILIASGATRYTPFGEKGYLQRGDTIYVVVYDEEAYSAVKIEQRIAADQLTGVGLSLLKQTYG